MISQFSELWPVLLSTCLIFTVLLFLFRKHIIHLLDPLFFFLVTQAFSIQLALMTISDTRLLFGFLASEIFFIAGFFSAAGTPLKKIDRQQGIFFKNVKGWQISVLKWYAIIATIVLIAGNLFLIKEKGIALFSDNPSEAKVNNFTEGTGLGIVRRMNSSLIYITALILIFLFVYKKQLRYAFLAFILIVFEGLSGSKSALLFFVFLSSFFFYFKDLNKDSAVKKIRVGSYVILIVAAVLSIVIIISSGAGSLNNAVLGLGTRFLFYGDAMLYYYNPSSMHYFSDNNFISFLKDEFNSPLGLLRLAPYREPINFRLINYFYNNPGNETYGPNVPFYIKGNIYFGFFGGLVYSFIIGSLVGVVRRLFYSVVRGRTSSIIISLLIIYLNLTIYSLPQDSPLFINKVTDVIFLSLPLLVVVFIIHLPVNKNRFQLQVT